jgi:DNA-binding CsgD family transcriptional regulator
MVSQPIDAPRSLRVLAEASERVQSALLTGAPEQEEPGSAGLIGRERELAQLNRLVEHVSETGSAMLIRGAPGTGKSALVAALVEDVRDRPVAILRASGIRAEANLAYAGLHQLLRPVLGELGSLRRQQRRAIEAALRMTASPPPDPFLISIATLELLSVAARPGLVIVVEDAHWLDRRTSEVLSFVARRLSSDPILLLITARDDRRSPILEAGLDEMCLEGFSDHQIPRRSADRVEPEQPVEPARARLIALRDATSADIADPSMARDLIDLAGVAIEDGDAMLARRLLWTAAQHVLWVSSDPDARLAATGLVARIGAQPDDPWLLATSSALGSADPASIIKAAGRYEQFDVAASDLLLVGISCAIVGDAARSRLMLARAAPAIRSEGDRPLMAQLLVIQAWNDIHLGRWAEATSEIAEGAELARETQQTMWSSLADIADALVAALRGDEESVDLALARARSAAAARGQGWLASTIEVVRGIGDLNAGRADAAYTRLRDRLTGTRDASLWAIDHFADAAVLIGKVEEGRAALAACGDEAEGRRGPLEVASLEYARAVLSQDETADQRQALAIQDLEVWPIHQARLQLHRGAWLRRQRRVADSRVPLRAAGDLFEALGAAPLTARARRELRASGERRRQRDIAACDQLSPQESEIAHMAAKGLTNREIGEQLFLSHRTVGAHLYRVFPKLGVTSRGQLHTALASRAGNVSVASS